MFSAQSLDTPRPADRQTGRPARIAGLDSLRFVAAFFVVMAHALSEPPIFDWLGLDATHGIPKVVQGIYWKFFFTGISGVIVFFIISGLCIHLPQTGTLQIRGLKSYYTRRLLRIIPPIIPVVFYYHHSDGMTVGKALSATILWSVVCEIIYYLIYPLLLLLRRRQNNWWNIIAISYVACIGVILTDPASTSYWSYGPYATWILGLPCWLLGAEIAEMIQRPEQPCVTTRSIFAWRLSTWCLAAFCVALKFRTPLGDPWTMNLFAVFAFFWIHREIVYFTNKPPSRLLESFGIWSFSLYITHQIFWQNWRDYWNIQKPYGFFEYFGTLAAILFAAYGFYLIVELPTHKFSRRMADRLKRT